MICKRLAAELATLRAELSAAALEPRLMELAMKFFAGLDEDLKRIEHERQMRQAEELQMEMALCFSEDAVCITAKGGDVRMVNPAFERLTGYAGAEMIGQTLDRLWEKAPVPALAALQKTMADGAQWRGELVCETKGGELLTTELSATPIITPSGAPSHWVFIQRDITARRRMEQKVAGQKELLEKTVNLALNAIAVISPAGEWELDNLSAKTLLSDMGPGARAKLAALLLAAIGGSTMVKGRQLAIPLADGGTGLYQLDAERIPARYLMPEGGPGHLYLVTLADIAPLERKNREILVRQKALSSSRMEQGLAQAELANGFIYRMRQPLNVGIAIAGRMAELLARNDVANMEVTAKLMREQFEMMERELMRFKANAAPPESRGLCRAADLAAAADILYRGRCLEKGVALEIECAEGGTVLPYAEEILLMALIKLLDNACESAEGRPGARIRLAIYPHGEAVCLSVEENGPGIAEADRYKVFEPFHSTKPGRRGLSLTLAHQVINRSGGFIDLDVSPLGGARFVIRLPMMAGEAP